MHITIASTHKPKPREAVAGEKPPVGHPEATAGGPAPTAAIDTAGSAPASTGE